MVGLTRLHRLMDKAYNGYDWHMRNRKKAAKKLRVRKKWKKRFGGGVSSLIFDSSSFWDRLRDDVGKIDDQWVQEIELGGN